MLDFSLYPRFTSLLGKNILSIDFGFKVIGTAQFCPGRDPFPYSSKKILYQTTDQSLAELMKIVEDESIDVIVFGIPYYLDGKESDMTKKIKLIADRLQKLWGRKEFYEQDETLTTEAAKNRMLESPEYNFKIDPTKIDSLSACIILEDFLRS